MGSLLLEKSATPAGQMGWAPVMKAWRMRLAEKSGSPYMSLMLIRDVGRLQIYRKVLLVVQTAVKENSPLRRTMFFRGLNRLSKQQRRTQGKTEDCGIHDHSIPHFLASPGSVVKI